MKNFFLPPVTLTLPGPKAQLWRAAGAKFFEPWGPKHHFLAAPDKICPNPVSKVGGREHKYV